MSPEDIADRLYTPAADLPEGEQRIPLKEVHLNRAPALVAWYGAPGVSVSIGVGSVGWFPLGPREVYAAWYGYNRRYISGINIGHVGSIDYGRVQPPRHYVHQTPRTSTWVPNDAVIRHEPIRRVIHTPPADVTQFVAGRPRPLR